MQPFSEELRFVYSLKQEDIIIDVGGYEGAWSSEMCRRYQCRVIILEPVLAFYQHIKEKFSPLAHKVTVIHAGLGAKHERRMIGVQNDSSGVMADSPHKEMALFLTLPELMITEGLKQLSCVKINAEGCEFEVLEHILDNHLQAFIKNIQVQFHAIVPDFQKRYESILSRLLETHHLTYDEPWCWQNFALNQ